MREMTGDIWTFAEWPHVFLLITTNGTIKGDGAAVMGRGVALQAKDRYPRIEFSLGAAIVAKRNRVSSIGGNLIAFPVKHNWWERADLELIKRSTEELKDIASVQLNAIFILPRPGCNNGKRDWETEVKPIVSILPDNVWVISP